MMDWISRLAASSLTAKLVGATVAAWAIVALFGLQQWAYGFGGFIPLRFENGVVLDGALPALLTPLSATLLHANVMHIAFNMLLLFFCGRHVERVLGAPILAALYVVGAYVAAFGHFLFNSMDGSPMIGASGAVSAIVGAYALLFSKPREGLGGWKHVASLAIGWIVIQLLIGLSTFGSPGRIAIVAHIFGFIAGLALARPLLLWRYRDA